MATAAAAVPETPKAPKTPGRVFRDWWVGGTLGAILAVFARFLPSLWELGLPNDGTTVPETLIRFGFALWLLCYFLIAHFRNETADERPRITSIAFDVIQTSATMLALYWMGFAVKEQGFYCKGGFPLAVQSALVAIGTLALASAILFHDGADTNRTNRFKLSRTSLRVLGFVIAALGWVLVALFPRAAAWISGVALGVLSWLLWEFAWLKRTADSTNKDPGGLLVFFSGAICVFVLGALLGFWAPSRVCRPATSPPPSVGVNMKKAGSVNPFREARTVTERSRETSMAEAWEAIAPEMKAGRLMGVMLLGGVDRRPLAHPSTDIPDNEALAQRRAEAAKAYFSDSLKGIPVFAGTAGALRLAHALSPSDMSRDRRVDVWMILRAP